MNMNSICPRILVTLLCDVESFGMSISQAKDSETQNTEFGIAIFVSEQ